MPIIKTVKVGEKRTFTFAELAKLKQHKPFIRGKQFKDADGVTWKYAGSRSVGQVCICVTNIVSEKAESKPEPPPPKIEPEVPTGGCGPVGSTPTPAHEATPAPEPPAPAPEHKESAHKPTHGAQKHHAR